MNTARWIKEKKEKRVRRIPLFCSTRNILEQLLEIHKLKVGPVRVPCGKDYYKVENQIVSEDDNEDD